MAWMPVKRLYIDQLRTAMAKLFPERLWSLIEVHGNSPWTPARLLAALVVMSLNPRSQALLGNAYPRSSASSRAKTHLARRTDFRSSGQITGTEKRSASMEKCPHSPMARRIECGGDTYAQIESFLVRGPHFDSSCPMCVDC